MRKIKRSIMRHKLEAIGQRRPNKVLSDVMRTPWKIAKVNKAYDKEMAKRKKEEAK